MGYPNFLGYRTNEQNKNRSSDVVLSPRTPSNEQRNPFDDTVSSQYMHTSQSASPSESEFRIEGMNRGSNPSSNRTSNRTSAMDDVRNQVMLNYLYQQQSNNGWRSTQTNINEGVLLRLFRDSYLALPENFRATPIAASLQELNVQSAMTINSPVIKAYLKAKPDSVDIPLLNGLAVQVIPNAESLARARTYHFAAVIASDAVLVVWDDDAQNLLNRAKTIEWELTQLLWRADPFKSGRTSRADFSIHEKEIHDDSSTEELAAAKPRPAIFISSVLTALSLTCMIGILGIGLRALIIEVRLEEGYVANPYTRFAFLAMTPLLLFLGLFLFNVFISNIAQMIGPIQQMNMNSKHYSAKKSPRITRDLPHVTIQCPVYKESLREVIVPTIQSIKKAISTYEMQGGSANIFVNDDGLQLLNEEMREERLSFYADNGIGWVARPGESKEADGFKRKGKFKKASNMNFGLSISCAMEDKLLSIRRREDWTSIDEAEATALALEQVVLDRGSIAWADGNIRIGDYILLIDSDTRVPTDCLLDAVSELETSPDVAILQFSSGVMNVTGNYFENGITFFTNLIYSAIRYGVANGDVAPFVGHNAILRWSALQDVVFEEDGIMKFWSESHVSEDFDMALRLQVNGYTTRLAAWAGEEFQEGVSLTVHDELARWQKYAYGCNELMFHPIRFWIIRGPFTPLFLRFLFSNMPLPSKLNIISYIGTYYAIGAAWIGTTANYFIIGWFKGYIDKYYISSWNVWLTLIVVFSGLGNLALATLRYRTGERSFIGSLAENIKWIFLLYIFLGGISIHVSQALLAHMFEINMTWGSTAKTMEYTNFFVEFPKTLRRFWFSFTFCVVMIAAMIILGTAKWIPFSWGISQIEAVVPVASLVFSHLLLPLALNPGLMTFAW